MQFHRGRHWMISSEDLADLIRPNAHWQVLNGVGALGDITGLLTPMDPKLYRKSEGASRGKAPMWIALKVLENPRFMPTVLRKDNLRQTVIAKLKEARAQQQDAPAQETAPERLPCALVEIEPEDIPLDDVTGPNVFEHGGKLFTDSRHVAKEFGMRHDHLLEKIDNLFRDAGRPLPNFREGSYRHANTGTQEHRLFIMDRDGFMLLTMGLTGAKALNLKLDWIAEFNRMEALLQSRALPAPEPLTREQRLAQAVIEATAVIGEQKQTIIKLEQDVLQKEEIIARQTPKAEGYDAMVANPLIEYTYTESAKSLNVGRGWLIVLLQNQPFCWHYRLGGTGRLQPKKPAIDQGYMRVKSGQRHNSKTHPDGTADIESSVLTTKGLEYVRQYLRSQPFKLVS